MTHNNSKSNQSSAKRYENTSVSNSDSTGSNPVAGAKTLIEQAKEWSNITWDESDLPEEERTTPETIALAKVSGEIGYVAGYNAAQSKYHSVAEKIWLLMFKAFHGGAVCTEEQMPSFKEAREIAHENLQLGNRIVPMTAPKEEEK